MDKYLGYNNYIRDTYSAEIKWRPSNKLTLDARAFYRVYNYENAFAYHNPIAGRKTLQSLNANFFATYKIAWDLTLMLQYNLRDVQSSDARIAYNRAQYILGIRWDY